MKAEDKILQHIVKVNEGSGVVMQPSTKTFSYIFTAKHCVQANSEDTTSPILEPENVLVRRIINNGSGSESEIQVRNIYYENDLDVAILEVTHIDGIHLNTIKEEVQIGQKLHLWGFPEYAKKLNKTLTEQVQTLSLEVLRRHDELYEFRNLSQGDYEEIQGYSGGGIFHICEEKVKLVAIENRMSNRDAQHQHIIGLPIKLFYKLIEKRKLQDFLPLYMSDIGEIQSKIFHFNNCLKQSNLARAKTKLLSIAEEYIKNGNSSPSKILAEMKESLLVPRRNKEELENECFWVALLEIVIIKGLIDENIKNLDIGTLRCLFESIRLIFINSEESWKRYIHEILFTDLSKLRENGIALLILIGDKNLPDEPVLDKRYFDAATPDIFSAVNGQQNLIDTVESSPILTGKVKVIHFAKLQDKCFLDKELEIKGLTSSQVPNFLGIQYSNYIPKMD